MLHALKPHAGALTPLIISAPMRVISGPKLALAVSGAGGLGFIGPGVEHADTDANLEAAQRAALEHKPHDNKTVEALPVGVGFQMWNTSLAEARELVRRFRPCAVWLFAPSDGGGPGSTETRDWIAGIHDAARSPPYNVAVWLQVGTVSEAVEAMESKDATPDVLVLQSSDAGGHGRATDGSSLGVLVSSVLLALRSQGLAVPPIVPAGGIVTGTQAAAAIALCGSDGAGAVAMGSRFLATPEARINAAYQRRVVEATLEDRTVRTQLYNHLRGTTGWPAQWSPRGLTNASWREWVAARGKNGSENEVWGRAAEGQGVQSTFSGPEFEELKRRHDEAVRNGGEAAWGKESGRTATYVGAGVQLINEVKRAAEVVDEVRGEIKDVFRDLARRFADD